MNELKEAPFIAYMYNYYKRNAQKKPIDWALSKDAFSQLVFKKCHYCNAEPLHKTFIQYGASVIRRVSKERVNGIDRLDNDKGYVIDNCVPCCMTCNRMKLALSVDEFLIHIKKIFIFKELK